MQSLLCLSYAIIIIVHEENTGTQVLKEHSHSLIIHQVKTKEITTIKEVWIPGLISIDFDEFLLLLLSFCFD